MILSIASGKGGTGKTTVAVNLALSLENVQLLDCDVEEPNAHLFLGPGIEERQEAAVPVPEIIDERCTLCGKCQEVCAFNSIAVIPPNAGMKGSVLVFPNLCHGCGACFMLCPEKAIREIPRPIGVVEAGRARPCGIRAGQAQRRGSHGPSADPAGQTVDRPGENRHHRCPARYELPHDRIRQGKRFLPSRHGADAVRSQRSHPRRRGPEGPGHPLRGSS